MKAVIIAAGFSSRILQETNGIPKTLLPFGNGTILSAILNNFSRCGIKDFILVIGCESRKIINYVEMKDYFDYHITFVENPDWEKGNGLSVLAAEEVVAGEPFILSMSDHIIPASAIDRLIKFDSHKNLLLVDQRIDKIFDIDDATKVYVEMNKIIRIGKNIKGFNGIDCGVFRLNNRYFEAMRTQLKAGKESNTAAIEGLIQNYDMMAVFMEEHEDWIDIDTPAAYYHALKIFV
jgi:choline kinase